MPPGKSFTPGQAVNAQLEIGAAWSVATYVRAEAAAGRHGYHWVTSKTGRPVLVPSNRIRECQAVPGVLVSSHDARHLERLAKQLIAMRKDVRWTSDNSFVVSYEPAVMNGLALVEATTMLIGIPIAAVSLTLVE